MKIIFRLNKFSGPSVQLAVGKNGPRLRAGSGRSYYPFHVHQSKQNIAVVPLSRHSSIVRGNLQPYLHLGVTRAAAYVFSSVL